MNRTIKLDPRWLLWITIGLIAIFGLSSQASKIPSAYVIRNFFKAMSIVVSFLLIFFLPGSVYAAALLRRRRSGIMTIVISSIALQYTSLFIATTLIKCFGWIISPSSFLVAELALCLPAVVIYNRLQPLEVSCDLRVAVLLATALVLAVVCALYWQRLNLTIDDYWLGDRIEMIRFGDAEPPTRDISIFYQHGFIRDQEGLLEINSTNPSILIINHSDQEVKYPLLYFIRGRSPSKIELIVNSSPLATYNIPQGFFKYKLHVFGNQCIISEQAKLKTGKNVVQFHFKGVHREAPFSGDLQDFSGLTKQQFIEAFTKRNGLLNIGHMYDIREVFTFGNRLRDKLYLWGDRFSTNKREGYICVSLPAANFQDMYILAAIDNFPLSLHLAFFLRTLLLILGIAYLAEKSLNPVGSLGLLALVTVTTAYCTVAINCAFDIFPDTFFLMAFFASLIFLIEKYDRLWLLTGLMAALSRVQAIEIVVVSLIAYGFIFDEKRRMIRLLALFVSLLLLFAIIVFLIGWANDLMAAWRNDIGWEFFYKSLDEVSKGFTSWDNILNLIKWIILTSCFIPFGLKFRSSDKIIKILMITMAVYIGHLLLSAHNKIYRMHYVAPAVFLFLLWFLRGWGLEDTSGKAHHRGRLFVFVIVGIAVAIYLMVVPFDYPSYNTVSPTIYQLLKWPCRTLFSGNR